MRIVRSLALCLVSFLASGQEDQGARNAFLQLNVQDAFEQWNILKPSVKFHSGFRPYLSATYRNASDSVLPFASGIFNHAFLSRTFREEKRNHLNVQFHPLVEITGGYDQLLSRVRSTALGGLHAKLNINDDFTFAGTFVGGNIQLPFFLDTSVAKQRVIPEFGQGYRSRHNTGYNLFEWQGYISYTPLNNKRFNFQIGRDKHFIGDGYRSLLLSDFAPPYPYFRINANVWRIQYNVWYSWFYDVSTAQEIKSKYTDKFGTFHYLSYNIVPGLNIAFFENVIWRGSDTNQSRTFDPNYLNPVILYRPVEYSIGSADNSFIGLNLKAVLFRRLKLYGQVALDEFFLKEIRARRGWWANKQGWQAGFRYVNALGTKGLSLQGEFNEVRPYTYTHGLIDQNYGHYGYPLAHPLGANFRELLAMVEFRHNRQQFNICGMYAICGRDSADPRSNVGQNIFLSYTTRPFDYGHHTGQGIRTVVSQLECVYTLHLLPALNSRIEVGFVQRAESSENGYILQNPWYFLSLKTGFWNSYRDF
jgi:hypothetical protein